MLALGSQLSINTTARQSHVLTSLTLRNFFVSSRNSSLILFHILLQIWLISGITLLTDQDRKEWKKI
jgi:hypothetical protein